MCGRFTLRTPTPVLAQTFRFELTEQLRPRFNIAPTQSILTVRLGDDATTEREATEMHWGLVPSWSKDPSGAARLINCRSETAASKPSFRSAFKRRRCLILSDGYYEWERIGKQRLPWYIQKCDQQPFAMAGIWEAWSPKETLETGSEPTSAIRSCTILTTAANQCTAQLHDRMPVILSSADEKVWLDPQLEKHDELAHLFDPFPSEDITLRPVSTHVNNARHEDEECLEPRDIQGELF